VHINLHSYLLLTLLFLLFDDHLVQGRRMLEYFAGWYSFFVTDMLLLHVLFLLCCSRGRCLVGMQMMDRRTQGTHAAPTKQGPRLLILIVVVVIFLAL